MAYVYRHIRFDKNEVFYIGISNINDDKYFRANSKRDRNSHWRNIIKKTDYKIDILFDNVSWDFAKEKEIELIQLYGKTLDGTGTLCNITSGGEGTLNLKWDESRRQKIVSAISGLKRSDEAKLNMAKSRLGRKLSLSHKNNISKALKNKKWSNGELDAKRNASSKIVINYQSGIFYSSIKEAAIAHNINASTLSHKLLGLRKNNTYLRYVND